MGIGNSLLDSCRYYIFLAQKKKEDGAIVINKADPMKDTYTLELYIPFGELDEKKKVIFKVHEE